MINKQNRSKIFVAIIGILLVANVALVSFLLMKKEPPKKSRPDKRAIIAAFLKNEIGFDTVQLREYDTLSKRHTDFMKGMDSLRPSKEKQFKELAAVNFSDSAMNAIADRSTAFQRTMELRMYGHLRNIRLLCKPEQVPKFDSLFGKVLTRRSIDQPKKQTNK